MRRELSEATLDALAATRSTRSLSEAIELHRALFAADLYIPRLHQRSGNGTTTSTWKDSAEPGVVGPVMGSIGWTGMEFTSHFARYLDAEYGMVYPWSNGLLAMRENHCRRTHREHMGRTEWRGSLCYQLVTFTVTRKLSLWNACEILGVTPSRNEPVLLTAFAYIEAEMDAQRERAEKQAKPHPIIPDWRDPARVHHVVGGLHAAECEQCRRSA